MKEAVFNSYVRKVTSIFNISQEELFSKSKKRVLVDARHLLYYLCAKRPMQIRYIQDYMSANGYDVGHSTIIHGIAQVKDKVEQDVDYKQVCNELS